MLPGERATLCVRQILSVQTSAERLVYFREAECALVHRAETQPASTIPQTAT